MSHPRPVLRAVIRVAVDAILAAGFLFFPWGAVVIGIFVSSAVFRWYLEAFAFGFLFAVLSGFPAWKAVVAFGAAVVTVEALKLRLEPRQWFSYLPIAAVSAFAFSISFFLVL